MTRPDKQEKRELVRLTRGSRDAVWPLMRVRNSSCLTLLLCMSILRVSSRVNRNLCSSYKPRAAYLCTSKVMYSMMLAIRLLVIGLLEDLLPKRKAQGYTGISDNELKDNLIHSHISHGQYDHQALCYDISIMWIYILSLPSQHVMVGSMLAQYGLEVWGPNGFVYQFEKHRNLI